MKIVFYALLILFSFVIQTTAFHFIPWFNVYPDIALALAIHGGLRWRRMGGLQFGGLVGFLQDLLLYGSLGINLLAKGLIGFTVGALRERYINDSVVARIALVVSATAFDLFIYDTMTNALLGGAGSDLFAKTVVSKSIANMVFIIVALPVINIAESFAERLKIAKKVDLRSPLLHD